MSRDERRDLAEISRDLSQDEELLALAHLFAETPASPRVQAPQTARHHPHWYAVVALLVAVLAFLAGCVVASVDGPQEIAAGALLVLCSAVVVTVVLVRHQRRDDR